MPISAFNAYLDESSVARSEAAQEYLVCAALLEPDQVDMVREELRPLLRPGQIKLHWTDESSSSRRRIVQAIGALGPMNVIVTHLSERQRKTERFRRKCLEVLYYQLADLEVYDLTLECRTEAQDKRDRAHIVALQGQGLDRGIRISHRRGGDEPLLWISDIVLGAVNASHIGEHQYLEALEQTIYLKQSTPESLVPTGQNERP